MAKSSQDKVSRYPDRLCPVDVSELRLRVVSGLVSRITFSLSGCLEVSVNHPLNTFLALVHVLLNLCDTFSIEF